MSEELIDRRLRKVQLGAAEQHRSSLQSTAQRVLDAKTNELFVAVLGAPKVGKTALVSQFLWDALITEYRPTVEEFNWIEYEMGAAEEDEQQSAEQSTDDDTGGAGRKRTARFARQPPQRQSSSGGGGRLQIKIIDLGGSRDWLAQRHLYEKTADAFLVLFALDDADSFDEAKWIYDEILQQNGKAGRTKPVVLLANKTDLFDSSVYWHVRVDTISAFVDDAKLAFTSLSAYDGNAVKRVFEDLFQRLCSNLDSVGGRNNALKKRRQSMPVGALTADNTEKNATESGSAGASTLAISQADLRRLMKANQKRIKGEKREKRCRIS